jgi:cbb3-type cytochrome oxidase maturation protein
MSSLFVLIPLGLLFTALAAGFLLLAVRGGQFEDLKQIDQRMPDDED